MSIFVLLLTAITWFNSCWRYVTSHPCIIDGWAVC